MYAPIKEREGGNVRLAFRLMLVAAKLGEIGAQVNVGNMYDTGVGTKRNRQTALYWYKRAYRRGCAAAAHNIGTVWRDDRNFKKALYWFERALELNGGDDGEASFEIAKLYLTDKSDLPKAICHLKKVIASKNVTKNCVEQAKRVLKRIMSKGAR